MPTHIQRQIDALGAQLDEESPLAGGGMYRYDARPVAPPRCIPGTKLPINWRPGQPLPSVLS